jgi:hypothetical protein
LIELKGGKGSGKNSTEFIALLIASTKVIPSVGLKESMAGI